ncbi:MAG: hypothetical protein OSB58_22110, partial [Alphaproteobacteria bacterium]|nr:hypothetical protein [Alphaproteobacteria bacterium]
QNLATTPCGMLGIQPVRLADNSLLDVILLILPVAKALGATRNSFMLLRKLQIIGNGTNPPTLSLRRLQKIWSILISVAASRMRLKI